MNENHLSIAAALAGIAWVFVARGKNAAPASSSAQATPPSVPWYLNYNTTSPMLNYSMPTLPSQSSGIQNDSGYPPCTTCAMFGQTYGSQF